jgi:hypothetical protein
MMLAAKTNLSEVYDRYSLFRIVPDKSGPHIGSCLWDCKFSCNALAFAAALPAFLGCLCFFVICVPSTEFANIRV